MTTNLSHGEHTMFTTILLYTPLILLLGFMALCAIGPLIIDDSIDEDNYPDHHRP